MKHFIHSFKEPQTVILWFTYWMYLFLIPALIAFLINIFKSSQYTKFCINGVLPGDEDGEPKVLFASHHQWLYRTFVILFIMSLVSVGTSYAGFGLVLAVVTVVVWFYRLAKGMFFLAAHKPMPGFSC